MSTIYKDDNIHAALEKLAERDGSRIGKVVDTPTGVRVKVKIPGGHIKLPKSVSRSYVGSSGHISTSQNNPFTQAQINERANLKRIQSTVEDINKAKAGKPHLYHHTNEAGKSLGTKNITPAFRGSPKQVSGHERAIDKKIESLRKVK